MEHSMSMPMKMTAWDSVVSKDMIFLDLVSGIGGALLFIALRDGVKNFNIQKFQIVDIFAVVVARSVTDLGYHSLVSKTKNFGGSLEEFVISSIVWFLIKIANQLILKQPIDPTMLVTQYLITFLVMLATARLTHWG